MQRSRLFLDLTDLNAIRETRQKIGKARLRYADPSVVMKKVQTKIESDYIRPMLTSLATQIPSRRSYPSDYPIEFTSDRQRRYVMWKLRGQPYGRTGNIPKGWKHELKIVDKKLYFKLWNADPASKYVVGTVGLGKSSSQMRRYLKPIQRFHQKTGWEPAVYTVQYWMDKAKQDAIDTLKQWIREGLNTG